MQGKSDFSIAGEVLPRTEQPISPCSGEPVLPLERRDQFGHHLAAALDVLSPSEQHRLMTALNQPSTGACVEAMWNLCMGSAPDGSDVEHTGHYSQPLDPQYYIDEGCWDSSPQCRQAGVSPVEYVQPYPVDTPADRTFCVGAKSMASWTQAGFRAQPPVAESQHPLRNAENDPVASQKRERVPTRKLLGSELGCEFESIESEQTIAKKKKKKPARSSPKPTVAVVTSVKVPKDGAGHAHKIRKPQSCKSSLRDRIWDLLHDSEKNKLLTEEMSAAEGAKKLLARRAAALGCKVTEIGDSDDWNIDLKLMQCKGQSEPLLVPRTCCLCLRVPARPRAIVALGTKLMAVPDVANSLGTDTTVRVLQRLVQFIQVFHRLTLVLRDKSVLTKHNYYCRRCQLIYRAIHRKKQNPAVREAFFGSAIADIIEEDVTHEGSPAE